MLVAAIVFDFDGTVADSFDYISEFLAAEAKVPPLGEAEKDALRGLSMAAMARQLGIRWWRMPFLFHKGRRGMGYTMRHVHPFNGMPDLIRKLHAEGHELFMVSSNSVRNLHQFLHHHDLHTYFLEVYGSVSLLGKAPALRKLLKEQNLEPGQVVYVGDELRDVEACQSLGIRVIAVAWGFARPQDLALLNPTKLVHDPAELLAVLEEI